MKINKSTLRRIIAEERAKLVREQAGSTATSVYKPVDGETISELPSELEELLAMEMREFFVEAIEAEEYEGTGPTWQSEIQAAATEYEQAIIDSGALKSIIELWSDVEDMLHNGEFAR